MPLLPPDWRERKEKSLKHSQAMANIIRDRGDHDVLPDKNYDYLKRAERFAHAALNSQIQGLENLSNNTFLTYEPKGTGDVGAFIRAIAQQESGGNYGAVNSSSGALGKYQIMPANIPSWSQEVLGRSISPQQFLSSPRLQDQIAQAKLRNYLNQHGVQGAASAWFSGRPELYKNSSQVANYVNSILRRMGQ